jgi:hypothetical protein
MFNHVRTGARGHHDITCCLLKDANHVFCNGTCLCTKTCVEVGLSATGLVGRELYVHAEAVENVHDGLTRLRVERIDETCHKELDVSHESIVIDVFAITSLREATPNLHGDCFGKNRPAMT